MNLSGSLLVGWIADGQGELGHSQFTRLFILEVTTVPVTFVAIDVRYSCSIDNDKDEDDHEWNNQSRE